MAAAVWEAVATRELTPICVTHDKMDASGGPGRPATIEHIRATLATIPWVETRDDTVCGHQVVVVLPKGHFDDPPSPPRPTRPTVRSRLAPKVGALARRLRERR